MNRRYKAVDIINQELMKIAMDDIYLDNEGTWLAKKRDDHIETLNLLKETLTEKKE